ncbi:ATP-dependent DNA helicase DinG [Bacillus altitudinis]|uniref:ATP-dependent DNA helicase DinG n=1 Tax=Bacillus altitudinis TaxID=293387 RepID=UPI000BC3449A|nr:ATP-dependent DNA helicase DinG [Bacillus altitudinis]ATH72639.1 ATP-dependent helicase DinG [Bacillus altitudinis]
MTDQRFVVVDIETTGNSPKKGDKIIQIAAVVIENGQIVERYSKYVNPGKTIPGFIEQLTGIKQHMVDDAVFFEDIAQEVYDLIQGAYFVAHNVHFDLNFLNDELKACGKNELDVLAIDTVEISRILYPELEGYKLTELSEELMLPHDHPHRADSDAEVTAMLFLTLLHQLRNTPPNVLKQLRRLSSYLLSDIGLLIKQLETNHSSQDDSLVEVGSFAVKDVTNPITESTYAVGADDEQLFEEIKEKLPQTLEGYEVREGQLTMMNKVRDAFHERAYALIEAAPGIGKTLAYLIPAALEAKKSGKPVIISTYSILLQQQMLQRDVPLLKQLLPFEPAACVFKGRAHYICLDKFEHVLHEEDDNYDVVLTKAQILMWLLVTETGDLSELNLPSGAANIKDRISCVHMPFTSKKRRFKEHCFYERAKRKAQTADLILTNHRLLLSQTEGASIFQHADVYVIDEAHQFEKTANETLGDSASYIQLHAKLTQLGSLHGGLLKILKKRFHGAGLSTDTFIEMDEYLQQLQMESDAFFSTVHSFVKRTKPKADINRLIHRVRHHSKHAQWVRIKESASKLCSLLIACEKLYEQQKNELLHKSDQFIEQFAFEAEEYDQVMSFMQTFCSTLYRFIFEPNNDETVWIEIDAKGAKNAVFMHAQPLDTGELLADRFFMNKKSVVLTSGTLTINQRFDYCLERFGLQDFYPHLVQIDSPFELEKQLKVVVPADMPPITNRDEREYVKQAANYIKIMEKQDQAKILVLFNSHEMLKAVYEELKSEGMQSALFAQGLTGGSPVKLTKMFKLAKQAILLGTGSFWEGVDFPGSELTTVIMARLPFRPPDSPLIEAKCEAAKKQGKNPFKAVALPEAVLTFKQGAGRLLRSEKDIGTLLILDRRVKTASYGKLFLESLHHAPVHEMSKESLEAYIEKLNNEKPLS